MDAMGVVDMVGVCMVEDMEYMGETIMGRVGIVKEVNNENIW